MSLMPNLNLITYFSSILVLVRPPDLFHPGPGFLPMHHGGPHHLNPMGNGKRKKSWTRAVFSHLQRKGLEKRFQMQKYITKPDRRLLAASLGLTDAQVRLFSNFSCMFLNTYQYFFSNLNYNCSNLSDMTGTSQSVTKN